MQNTLHEIRDTNLFVGNCGVCFVSSMSYCVTAILGVKLAEQLWRGSIAELVVGVWYCGAGMVFLKIYRGVIWGHSRLRQNILECLVRFS